MLAVHSGCAVLTIAVIMYMYTARTTRRDDTETAPTEDVHNLPTPVYSLCWKRTAFEITRKVVAYSCAFAEVEVGVRRFACIS